MKIFNYVFLLLMFTICDIDQSLCVNNSHLHKLYNTLFEEWKTKYDKRLRPNVGDEPVEVEVNVFVTSLRSISEVSMSYEIDIYFREQWHDPRLVYDLDVFNNKSKVTLHQDLANLLWMPDTFLPNSLEVGCKKPGDSVTHKQLLHLKPNGTLFLSRRFSLIAECPMDLMLYPFDRQICRLSIESYGHDIEDILYRWHPTRNVTINPELELPEFKIAKYEPKQRRIHLSTGIYSRLELCFYFERRPGYFITSLFFPATGIVAISWVTLCLGNDSTISDIIQIILAIIFLNFTQNTVMPKVSYIKAIDVFMGACLLFVFLSLLKLSVSKYLLKTSLHGGIGLTSTTREEPANHKENSTQNNINNATTADPLLLASPMNLNAANYDQEKVPEHVLIPCRWLLLLLDKVSTYLLPLLFTSFCLFYFVAYYLLRNHFIGNQCNF